jgi:predicted RNA-binding Zn-ribbon protein involved in translation (DUF1610 family)
MDELTRFARVLVERLGARPGGTPGPVSVRTIRTEILPYRTERRNLGLSSVEDYETVLLRLVAEERGFVRTTPPEAAQRCRDGLAHPNPDLGILEAIAEATIQFTSLAAAPILSAEPEPESEPEPAPAPATSVEPTVRPTAHPANPACPHCRGDLPAGRTVVFCPWCGERLIPLRCESCGSELESGWKHCITCGAPVRDPHRRA